MTRSFHIAAFMAGLFTIAWVGAGYLPGNPLALALVLLIAAVYLAGAAELQRFRLATAGLTRALSAVIDQPPSSLEAWLAGLNPNLSNAVRLRVEGERVGLPGPSLTPYLTGLLVLLGMLGTFLGMIVTLKGTGLALEHAADVEAIRASLAAPIKGLGLAFGTSVAGVAASAMLGLMSALARRERQQAARQLDACIAGALRVYSRAHQRTESLRLQTEQAVTMAEVMPALVAQLQALVARLDQQGQALHDRLSHDQTQFHAEVQRAYTGLASDVGQSLASSLSEGARLAGAVIEPAIQATMASLARETAKVRDALTAAVHQQLEKTTAGLDTAAAQVIGRWEIAQAHQQRHRDETAQALRDDLDRHAISVEQRSAALLADVARHMDRSATQWSASWGEVLARQGQDQASQVLHTRQALAETMAGFAQETTSLLQAMACHQQQICSTLERTAESITAQADDHARATLAEVSQLMRTASEAPRAAADVIAELRRTLGDSLVRDNAELDERNRLMATLGGLLDAVNHASTEQRASIDALVGATADVLDRVGGRFADTVDAESRTLQTVSAQLTVGGAEVASLAEGFGAAVQVFGRTSEQLSGQLSRIEAALDHTMARSDEQLAYYVAQAREIIDLTLGSQKQIVDDLRQLGRPPTHAAPALAGVAEAAA